MILFYFLSPMCKLCLPSEYILNPYLNCKPCPSEGRCIEGILKLQSGAYSKILNNINEYYKDFGEHLKAQI